MTGAGPRIIIVGGSIGGLTAALTLRDAGCDVVVYERARAPLVGQGAGIILNPATVRYFTSYGAVDVAAVSVGARWVRYMGHDGSTAAELPSALRFTSYNALYQGLCGCLEPDRYRLNHAVSGFAQGAAGVEVQLADGRVERCDLLVCADGIRSLGRRLLMPELALDYAGYVAWRGTVAAHELSAPTFALLREAFFYYLLPEGHFLTYPIPAGDRADNGEPPLINWLWYRNIAAGPALEDLMTASDGSRREVSLPPGMVQARHVAELRYAAAAQLPPPFIEVAEATAQPFIQLICDLEVPRMAVGRVCLIGDAACVARPHVAAGTAKAAEDGWSLAAAIRDAGYDLDAALGSWAPRQLRLGQSVVARSRAAGARVQFERAWQVGEPPPVGLFVAGDSAMDNI